MIAKVINKFEALPFAWKLTSIVLFVVIFLFVVAGIGYVSGVIRALIQMNMQ